MGARTKGHALSILWSFAAMFIVLWILGFAAFQLM